MNGNDPKQQACTTETDTGQLQEWAVRCLDRLFSAMADPTRLQILNLLAAADELTVGEITSKVGHTASAISHQLSLLRDRDLVRARRQGRSVHYSLSDEHARQLLEVGITHACGDCRHRR